MTYMKLLTLLNGRTKKKLAGNTYLTREGDTMTIRHHNTDIIKVRYDSDIDGIAHVWTLNNGGWFSMTTKKRLNQFTPFSIFQTKGQWYVSMGADMPPMEYHNGMILCDKAGEL